MGVLSAGIRSLLRKTEGADLSRPAEAPDPGARSSRNGGRHHLGTVGEIISERVGGIIPERRAASPGIGSLAELNTEHEQLAVNARRPPDWVGHAHLPAQSPDLWACVRPTNLAR